MLEEFCGWLASVALVVVFVSVGCGAGVVVSTGAISSRPGIEESYAEKQYKSKESTFIHEENIR